MNHEKQLFDAMHAVRESVESQERFDNVGVEEATVELRRRLRAVLDASYGDGYAAGYAAAQMDAAAGREAARQAARHDARVGGDTRPGDADAGRTPTQRDVSGEAWTEKLLAEASELDDGTAFEVTLTGEQVKWLIDGSVQIARGEVGEALLEQLSP